MQVCNKIDNGMNSAAMPCWLISIWETNVTSGVKWVNSVTARVYGRHFVVIKSTDERISVEF